MVTSIVGFTSSFAVVLTGLHAVGATQHQAASGLLVVCISQGVGGLLFTLALRRPITMAWSTPGAALLATSALPGGGYADAVGAFVVAGVLYLLTALVKPLATVVAAIPKAIANAMLAGVLLGLCVVPFRTLGVHPWSVAPILIAWLLATRFAPRWSVPAAFVTAIGVVAWSGTFGRVHAADLVPHVTWTTPHFDVATAIAIGVPLYFVTMTSQNIPGVAIPATFGYDVPLRRVLGYTGIATIATAGLGAFSVNLSAITAALTSSPAAHPDRDRRWIAGAATSVTYIAFGPLAATLVAVSSAAPAGVVASFAGIALLAAFVGAISAAVAEEPTRLAAAVTFVVTASGLAIAGIGAAFWGLLAGALVLALTRSHATS